MLSARGLFGWILPLGMAAASSPSAANPFIIETETPAFTSSFAMRYWCGMGSTSKDLYGFTPRYFEFTADL